MLKTNNFLKDLKTCKKRPSGSYNRKDVESNIRNESTRDVFSVVSEVFKSAVAKVIAGEGHD